MFADNIKKLSKYFVPAFYSAVMLLMIVYAWNKQSEVSRGMSGPLYQNLMEAEVYIRRGFDRAEIRNVPEISTDQSDVQSDAQSGDWVIFESRLLHSWAPTPW